MQESKQESESEGAAFNVAVATLMRLDNILIDIKNLILNKETSSGAKQLSKYRLTRAFYVQSAALIKDENSKNKIKDEIKKLSPAFKDIINAGKIKKIATFDWEFEEKLDDVLVLIQECLQGEGYFMPEKIDKGL